MSEGPIYVSILPAERGGCTKYRLTCEHASVVWVERIRGETASVAILQRLYIELTQLTHCRCQLPPSVLAAIDVAVASRVLSSLSIAPV